MFYYKCDVCKCRIGGEPYVLTMQKSEAKVSRHICAACYGKPITLSQYLGIPKKTEKVNQDKPEVRNGKSLDLMVRCLDYLMVPRNTIAARTGLILSDVDKILCKKIHPEIIDRAINGVRVADFISMYTSQLPIKEIAIDMTEGNVASILGVIARLEETVS